MAAVHSDIFSLTGNKDTHLSFFEVKSGRVQQLLMIFYKLLCIYYDCDIEVCTLFWNKKGKSV